jgi:DNA-binding MarR family transcriptional regulator
MPQDPSPASEALHKFLLIHRHLRQNAREVDDHHGLRPRQFAVLRYLLEHGPATVSDIQEYMYISASTASTMLSQIEEAGFVKRTRSEDDNRVVIVEITEVGSKLAAETPIGGIGLLRRRLPLLPEERIRLIDEALSELMQLMEVEATE